MSEAEANETQPAATVEGRSGKPVTHLRSILSLNAVTQPLSFPWEGKTPRLFTSMAS